MHVLRIVAVVVSVLLVVLVAALILLVLRLERGPLDVTPLMPWVLPLAEAELHQKLTLGQATLERDAATGKVTFRAVDVGVGGDGLRVDRLAVVASLPSAFEHLDLEMSDQKVEAVLAAWPAELSPEARRQVVAIVRDGVIERGRLDFEDGVDPADGLSLELTARDVVLDLPHGLPRTTAARLHLEIRNRALRVQAPSAEGADLDMASLGLEITDLLGERPANLRVRMEVEGEMGSVYRLLTTEPLTVLPTDIVEAGSIRGSGLGSVLLAMPLIEPFDPAKVQVWANGRVIDTASELKLPRQITVEHGSGAFHIADNVVRFKGRGLLWGAPFEVELHEGWGARDADHRLRLEGPVDAKWLAAAGLPFELPIEGSAATELELKSGDHGQWHAALDADLAELSFAEPYSGFTKAKGAPGRLEAEATLGSDAGWAIEHLDLRTTEQRLLASGAPEEDGFKIRVDRLRTPKLDLVADLTLDERRVLKGRIEAAQISLPPGQHMQEAAGAGVAILTGGDLAIRVAQLDMGGPPITELAGKVQFDQEGVRLVNLDFNAGGAGSMILAPENAERRFELRSANLGRFLAALGAGNAVSGGTLEVKGLLQQQLPSIKANGEVRAADLTLSNDDGSSISFDKVVLPFAVAGPTIALSGGRLTGSALGMTMAGTVQRATGELNLSGEIAPLFAVNRLIAQIPLLGRFLSGSQGLGAINLSYRLGGTLSSPQTSINGTSALLPGTIHDILRAVFR